MVNEDDRSLAVLIGGRRAGVVTMGATGRFSLTYDEAWREAGTATPLRRSVFPAQSTATAVNRFVDALAFNWIIYGTDGHAKNYSLLLSGSQVRLAPLYDVASALAYDDMYPPKLRMAMKIGDEYRVEATSGRNWRTFAAMNGLDPDETIARIDHLVERVPDAFGTVAKAETITSLDSKLPVRLTERISARAAKCRTSLRR